MTDQIAANGDAAAKAVASAAEPAQSRLAGQFAEVLSHCTAVARAQKRDDLVGRLTVTAERLAQPSVRVVVVGEFKKGKSAFINALLGRPVCPVDDHVATAVSTIISYGAEPTSVAVRADPATPSQEVRQPLNIAELANHVTEQSSLLDGLRRIEAFLPDALLKSGLVLVDTPGVGGLETAAAVEALNMVAGAHCVIFVSDASQEFTAPEVDFLVAAGQLCPTIICVLTKTDIFPHHQDVRALNQRHLAERKLPFPVMPVSCMLRDRAWQSQDVALNALSGFPELKTLLITRVLQRALHLTIQATVREVTFVLDQCMATLNATVAAAADPAAAGQLLAELKTAQEHAAMLRTNSARWQVVLNDGVADLTADVDFDLRSRFRSIGQEADDAIELSEPSRMWPEFCSWLERRVGHDVTENYSILASRAGELAERVAELFAGDEAEITHEVGLSLPEISVRAISMPGTPKVGDLIHSGFSLFRGAYSNMEMFSTLGSMLKWHFLGGFNPLSVGLGLLVGSRSVHDERKRQLETQRQQAKAAHRKYTDEVQFRVSYDSREALKAVQRQLRDSFTARAEQLARTTTAAVNNAQATLNSDSASRNASAASAQQWLKHIAALRVRLQAVADQARTVAAPAPQTAPTSPARESS
jgi:hypothetical protein